MAAQDLQRQYYEMLMESQYWSPEQMLAYQRSQLEQLLRHARAQVPFYEHRLDAVFARDGDINWDRWGEIPIVKRTDLLEHRDEMLARELPPGHGPTRDFTTSGSTGAPVTVTTTRIAGIALRASRWRMNRAQSMDWSRHVVEWMGEADSTAWPNGLSAGRWGPNWLPEATGEVLHIHRTTPPDRVLEFVKRRGAAYLTGRPKSLQYLALDAIARGAPVPLSGLLCFGTAVADDERADAIAAFGAPMWSLYSSKEGAQIAFQCPDDQLHINAEAVSVEIVADDDSPARPGEIGRVVITPLYNTAQPLIRYEQGDLAVAGTRCNCGRTLPTLQRVMGRVTNLFRFPDGAKVAPSVPDHFRTVLGAKYWQIAQVGPLDLEVRYVPFPGTVPEEDEFAAVVRRHIHRSDVRISFSRHETLERANGGKFVQYVCELPS